MIRPIRTAKPASEELTAAVQWCERQRAGLGGEFFDAILGTIDRISETPEAGSSFRTLDARRMLVAGFPYQIVYRISADEIRILAFAQLRRRPGFWRHRRSHLVRRAVRKTSGAQRRQNRPRVRPPPSRTQDADRVQWSPFKISRFNRFLNRPLLT